MMPGRGGMMPGGGRGGVPMLNPMAALMQYMSAAMAMVQAQQAGMHPHQEDDQYE
jgi:hypothetical protein